MSINDFRNLNRTKFYTTSVRSGSEGYNPKITMYYNSSDELIKVREEWRGEAWEQTISGTGISGDTISYQIIYDPWVQVSL